MPGIVTTPALHKHGAIVKLRISVKAVRDTHGEIIAVESIMQP